MDGLIQNGPVIALEHVDVSLGRVPVLKDISLTIDEGEFIVILGPNGAGKTTLLRLLLGLVRPSQRVDPGAGRPAAARQPGHRLRSPAPQYRSRPAPARPRPGGLRPGRSPLGHRPA